MKRKIRTFIGPFFLATDYNRPRSPNAYAQMKPRCLPASLYHIDNYTFLDKYVNNIYRITYSSIDIPSLLLYILLLGSHLRLFALIQNAI